MVWVLFDQIVGPYFTEEIIYPHVYFLNTFILPFLISLQPELSANLF